MFEHMLCTLASDFSIPLPAVTVSSTEHRVTSSLAPIHSDPHHAIFRDTPWVHTIGGRLTGRHVQPHGKENIAADTKLVNFFFWRGRADKIRTSKKAPSRKGRSSSHIEDSNLMTACFMWHLLNRRQLSLRMGFPE